jgi:hypothetical protein
MIYSGDNIEKDNNMCDSLCWNAINFNKYFNNININYPFIIPSDTEIYLVRHGQGYHNIKGTINKILNPIKFNLISKNWDKEICALGGIKDNNLKV